MSFSSIIVPTIRAATELSDAVNYRLCALEKIKGNQPGSRADNKMAALSGILAFTDGLTVVLRLTAPAIAARVELACLPTRFFVGAFFLRSDSIYHQGTAFCQTATVLERGVQELGRRTNFINSAKYLSNTIVGVELITRILNSITLTFLSR